MHACIHTHTHTFIWGRLETVGSVRSKREKVTVELWLEGRHFRQSLILSHTELHNCLKNQLFLFVDYCSVWTPPDSSLASGAGAMRYSLRLQPVICLRAAQQFYRLVVNHQLATAVSGAGCGIVSRAASASATPRHVKPKKPKGVTDKVKLWLTVTCVLHIIYVLCRMWDGKRGGQSCSLDRGFGRCQ